MQPQSLPRFLSASLLSSVLTGLLATGVCAAGSDSGSSNDGPDFDREVAPLLASRCLSCHSGGSPKGKLDLSKRSSVLSGRVVVPGNLAKSRLWRYIDSERMPPKQPLTAAEKQVLSQWIASGAKWGTDPIDPFRFTTSQRAGYDWWALQPVQRPAIPAVKHDDRVRTPVDAFVLARLEKHGLQFAADAAARDLVRRLHFDLIGLPPTPETVEAFCKNPTEKAYRNLVDGLLASPHYGERWARHWLDVARFGESDGFERNNPRDHFWPYRDWVIEAFNRDMPYDEFARMQIAGDLLRPGDVDGLASVGFLVAGVHNTVVGQSERMKRLARQDELEEIVGALGQTFLGLTVNCARCHDHKFDPIHQAEFYRVAAALAGVYHGEREGNSSEVAARQRAAAKTLQELQKQLASIDGPARKAILRDRSQGKAGAPEPPRPLARWEFDGDFKDSIGSLHGTPKVGAKLQNGALILDGKGHVETATLARDLQEKTLEAWVQLDDLNQRGGGVISVQTINGSIFDAIVYGEKSPRHWMAGSNFFRRTQPFAGSEETEAENKPVHFAIAYHRDGKIIGYRNGLPHGRGYPSGGLQEFRAGAAQVVFGMRHAPPGGNKMLRGKILRAQLYDRALNDDEVACSADSDNFVAEKEIVARLSPGQRDQRAKILRGIQAVQKEIDSLRKIERRKVYTVAPQSPGPTHVLTRGDVMTLGAKVTPGGIGALPGDDADFALGEGASDRDRRLKLAAWIASRDNPLFARVIVNRLWHYHFGTGIVATPSDFGFNGGRPSHPELLDWLAAELQHQGFRLKGMHRIIVLSTAYRQSSARTEQAAKVDADNRLLSYYSPRRIEAEVLRDAMLKIAGTLNPAMGGPGFRDVSVRSYNGTTYYTPIDSADSALARRTIYRFTPRGGRSSLLDTFDCPDPSAAAPRRSVTTTPLQALSLLNNAFVLRLSDAFAERLRKEAGTDVDRQVHRAFALVFARGPDPAEERLAVALVNEHGLPALCRALFNSNEFVIVP